MQPPFKLKRPKVKPVHLATGVFVARQAGFFRLERLNRFAMHQLKVMATGQHKGRVHPDDRYTSEKVFEDLRAAGILSDRVSREQMEIVRRAVHQFIANDQAAFHCYWPHRPFGNDYTTSDQRLVTIDSSHSTDGGLGTLLVSALSVTPDGNSVLTSIDDILAANSSFGDLVSPLIDDAEITPRTVPPAECHEVAMLMAPQTAALSNLTRRLRDNFTLETRARLLVLGLCLWVLTCILRWSERACGTQLQRLLLADFSQRPRRPLRRASWISVVQARRQLADYKVFCEKANPPLENPGNWADLFDFLGKRSGLIQPRSDSSRARRYVEPMPDTIRVLVMSSFKPEERLLPFGELARRFREIWSVVVGAADG